jgi:hypothetical protein
MMPSPKKKPVSCSKDVQYERRYLTVKKTKNYAMFTVDPEIFGDNRNRELTEKGRKILNQSMLRYGWLPCMPLVVYEFEGKKLVYDGQHKLDIAKRLKIPVYWVYTKEPFDIGIINSTAKPWAFQTHVDKFIALGRTDYKEAMDFSNDFSIPPKKAFALMIGNVSGGHDLDGSITEGSYKVRDSSFAKAVGTLYLLLLEHCPEMKGVKLIDSLAGIVLAADESGSALCLTRLTEKITERGCQKYIKATTSRDLYLDMLEKIYNHKLSTQVSVKVQAVNAINRKNPSKKR